MEEKGLLDFYPTPKPLLEKLLEGLSQGRLSSMDILEPSAGKGDIVDFLMQRDVDYDDDYYRYSRHGKPRVDCIEINADLQHVLRGKGYRVIFDDFLTFETRKPYDLIVANFPFSAGEYHLEKALRMLREHGGMLRCLVNAETLKNPCNNLRRMLLKVLEKFGAEIEYLQGEFQSAERKTLVEVASIKVQIEAADYASLLLDTMKKAEAEEADKIPASAVVEGGFIKGLISHFKVESEGLVRFIKEFEAIEPYILSRHQRPDKDTYARPLLKLEIECEDGYYRGDSLKDRINAYLQGVREKYWELLIYNPEFAAQYTSNIQAALHAKLKELRGFDFNLFNIQALQIELASQIAEGAESAILALFDKMSAQHSWYPETKNNTHYFDGWATTKAHFVNKKVIIPTWGLRAGISEAQRLNWETPRELMDIVRVFNYLADDKIDIEPLVTGAVNRAERWQSFDMDLHFVRVKFFKKGTMHLWFQDLDLLQKFNIFGSQRKGWLPPNYGKVPYEDLSQAERAVVDQFQGEDAYRKVVAQPERYLVESSQLLLTAGGSNALS